MKNSISIIAEYYEKEKGKWLSCTKERTILPLFSIISHCYLLSELHSASSHLPAMEIFNYPKGSDH